MSHFDVPHLLSAASSFVLHDGTDHLSALAVSAAASRLLLSLSGELASMPTADGLPNVVPVGLKCADGACLAVSELALAAAGIPFLPLSLQDPPRRVEALRARVGCRIVLDDARIRSALSAHTETPEPLSVVAARLRFEPVSAATVVYYIATSGSSGEPKLVIVEHRHLHSYVSNLGTALGIAERSRLLLASAATFDPSIGDIFGALAAGATLLCSTRAALLTNPSAVIAELRPTHVVASPAWWGAVDPDTAALDPRAVIALGGEALPAALAEMWVRRVRLASVYGLTEAVGYQAIAWVDPASPRRLLGIGQPMGTNVLSVDTSELVISGPQVVRGVLGDVPFNGSLRTGDLVAAEGDVLRLVGRRDFQVKLQGRRVHLEEVEALLCALPLVRDAVCVIVEPSAAVCVLEAVIVPAVSAPPALLSQVAGRLLVEVAAPAQRPSTVRVWPSPQLPLTTNDKVDRRLVRQWAMEAGPDATVEEPLSGPHRALANIVSGAWQSLLNVTVTPQTSFVHSGGDSLMALRAVQLVGRRLYGDSSATTYGEVKGALAPDVVLRYPVLRDYVTFLVAAGVSVEASGECDDAAPSGELVPPDDALFMACVSSGALPLVESLLDSGVARVDGASSRAQQRTSPLHLAAALPSADVLDALLRRGARTTTFDLQHVTPLHLAAQNSVAAVCCLHSAGAPIAVRDSRQQTVLHHAARTGQVAVVRHLLAQHCPPLGLGLRDRWQRTAVHWAALNGHAAVLQAFIDAVCTSALPVSCQTGWSKAKALRLCKAHTHLPYESPVEIALRLHGDGEIASLCRKINIE